MEFLTFPNPARGIIVPWTDAPVIIANPFAACRDNKHADCKKIVGPIMLLPNSIKAHDACCGCTCHGFGSGIPEKAGPYA